MKVFLILAVLMSVTLAHPSFLVSPLSNAQDHVGTSLSSPQKLSFLPLLPGAPLGPDGRVLDTLEVQLAKAQHETARRRAQVELARANARDALEQLASAPSSAASPSVASALLVRAQQRADANSLLSATRLAQSLASVSPLGIASNSRVQFVRYPEVSAA